MAEETTSIKKLLLHAIFLEAFGIIQKWQKAANNKPNKDLERLAGLLLSILDSHSSQKQTIRDLNNMNSYIRDDKNKEILTLRDEIQRLTLRNK